MPVTMPTAARNAATTERIRGGRRDRRSCVNRLLVADAGQANHPRSGAPKPGATPPSSTGWGSLPTPRWSCRGRYRQVWCGLVGPDRVTSRRTRPVELDHIRYDARGAEDDDPAGLESAELRRGRRRDRVRPDEEDRRARLAGGRGARERVGEVRPGRDIDEPDARGEGRLADRRRCGVSVSAGQAADGPVGERLQTGQHALRDGPGAAEDDDPAGLESAELRRGRRRGSTRC